MSIEKLKKYIDKNIGEHGYICIYSEEKKFYCEGIVSNLRNAQLWGLLDEENAKVKCAYSGTSENGKRAIIITLYRRFK
jgi:hypothetical protein